MKISISSKKELIAYLIRNKYIVMHEFIESLTDDSSGYTSFIESLNKYQLINNQKLKVFDKSYNYYVKTFGLNSNSNSFKLNSLNSMELNKNKLTNTNNESRFYAKIINEINYTPNKKKVGDFVNHFKNRLDRIKPYLLSRKELASVVSIKKISSKSKEVSLIGLVYEFHESKNGHLIIKLEDDSGMITCILSKNKKEVYDVVKNELVLDEVIGIVGVMVKDAIFINEVIFPEIPTSTTLKKINEEAYAVFFSDIHAGSTNFLEKNFEQFIQWINGKIGSYEQRMIALKTRYLFIAGDLVAGVGIYPGQDKELTHKDIYDQYKLFFEYAKRIPKYIKIIISPGNHDAMRLSEPQPIISPEYTKSLDETNNNFLFVTNPAYVEIGIENKPESLLVLLYHGYSFHYYFDKVPLLRFSGGDDHVDELMKLLLKKRHLAPSHTSSLYIPGYDYLVIDKIPDIFVSGHVHKYKSAIYKNITLIQGSCWESKTSFQEKVGNEPEPGKIAVLNLQTRKLRTINFA